VDRHPKIGVKERRHDEFTTTRFEMESKLQGSVRDPLRVTVFTFFCPGIIK